MTGLSNSIGRTGIATAIFTLAYLAMVVIEAGTR